ncbi:MAG TPA: uroporphyrinogen decarboxylase family protein [Anaerolineaceae bacterium]
MSSRIEMTGRERVLTAANRQTPDRVPRIVPLERYVHEALSHHFGTNDLTRPLKLDMIWVGPGPSRARNDYARYFTRPGVTWEDFGRGRIWDAEGQYAEYLYPLQNAESVDEILAFPWPDYTEAYRYAGLTERVEQYHRQGFAVCGALAETIFEIAWQIRSMDRLFEDIHLKDEKATVLLDQITRQRVAAAQAYARAGVDLIELGDDVAMQTGLLMSKRMHREWLKPRLQQVIQAAWEINPRIKIWYHSDGKINDLIPDLMEAGVQILNPVQPECVDHAWVKATYGDQLAFSGGLGVQSVLPFGTPDAVREHVRATIQTLGAGGGLIVGPSHVIERDVPLANILAMLEAMDTYGKYE